MKKYRVMALILLVVGICSAVLVQANTASQYLDNGFMSLFYHAVRLEDSFPRINPVGMAIEEFDKARSDSDSAGEANLMMGFIYQYLGRPGTALDYFMEFAELHPEEAWVHAFIGDLYTEMGRSQEAEQSYNLAIAASGEEENYARAYLGLGNAALEREDYLVAKEAFGSALQDAGDFFDARLGLGKSLYYLAEYEEAITTLELAQLQAPRSIPVFYYLALSYEAEGLDDKAQHALTRIEELTQEN